MSTTVKRISFCLTLETQRQLDALCEKFGENAAQVITRALQFLEIHKEIHEKENKA